MLLRLAIASGISREHPFAIDELDGSHQSWEFPSVLREVCEGKKVLSFKSISREAQAELKRWREGLTHFFLLLRVPDDNRHVQDSVRNASGSFSGKKDLLDEPTTKNFDCLEKALPLRFET